MDTAQRIDALIDRAGLSNQDVATAVGVSDETISRWRKGTSKKGPSLSEAVKLARRLGTTVEYLATGRQPVPTEITEDERYVLQLYRDLGLPRADAVRGLNWATRAGGRPGDYPIDAPGESDDPPHDTGRRRA
jgi:transcriptional regulator with XRE-family HTH domain